MEPISTLVLTAAFLVAAPATRIKIWEEPTYQSNKVSLSNGCTRYSIPTANVDSENYSTNLLELEAPIISPREFLKREISEYSKYVDGWNGVDTVAPDHASIESALRFIDAIPARLPLPRPMLSSSGEIGLYWDLFAGYAEASFDSQALPTFFSRSVDGTERFDEAVAMAALTSEWFWSAIGPLDSPIPVAA